MQKTCRFARWLSLLLLLPLMLFAAEEEVALKLFRVAPERAQATVGDTVTFTLEWETADGSTLYAWFAPLERRHAPEKFFSTTKRSINENATNHGYDNIALVAYHLVPGGKTAGSEMFSLSLHDFIPGEYQFVINAKFMKDNVQHTRVLTVSMEVASPAAPPRRTLAAGEPARLKDYLIYVPDGAPPSVKQAAQRLQRLVLMASGVRLPLWNEALTPFIALGDCPEARAAGIDPSTLPYEGYVLRKVGDDIFIAGRDMPDDGYTDTYGKSFGTSFGVNAFLENVLDISWLLPGERGLYLPPMDGDYLFGDIDESYAPRYTYRLYWARDASPAVKEWFAYNQTPLDHSGSRYYGAPHAWIWLYPEAHMPEAAVVPDREKTFKEHPDFFELSSDGRRVSPAPGQVFSLCLGNPATTEDIIRRIPKLVELRGERNPHLKGLKFQTLTPNDNAPYCACELCTRYRREVTEEETGPVAYKLPHSWTELVFNHIRTVCERLPDYSFACYIYHSTQYPYPGITPMPKNFSATMAPLHCGYGPVRLCDAINGTWHRWMESWRGVFADETYYGLDFWLRQYYGAPLPSCIGLMKDTFDEFARHPLTGALFYDNPGYGQSGLSTWVLNKMLWNPSLDPEELAAEYLRKAYGERAGAAMRQLHRLVDAQARAYYNSLNGQAGWDMDAEILAGLYAPIYPEIERLYLAAGAAGGDEAQRWRLAMFGENLKLLRYTLVSLGLLEDTPSPLHLEPEEYDRLNRARLPGGTLIDYLSPPAKPVPEATAANVKAEITDDLKGGEAFRPFSLQASLEMLIVPRKDGECELEFEGFTMRYNEAKKRNYLPQIQCYAVYNEDRSLYLSGMAKNGVIRFPVQKGKLYRFVYMPQTDFATRPYWYMKRCSEPYAIGHHHDGSGFRAYEFKSPLWFYVEPGTPELNLYIEHTYVRDFDIDLKDPDGKVAADFHKKNVAGGQISVEGTPKPGWWKLEFTSERGFCGYLRMGTGLTKYVVPDPENALKVETLK